MRRTVYLGGPIDLGGSDAFHRDIDWYSMGLQVYCPRCECDGLSDELCIQQNMHMLREAWLAVFDLQHHSIGTPIEMFLRCWIHQERAVIIGDKRRSLFIRHTANRFGVYVAPTLSHALAQIKEIASNG